ncbi:hypothetical protein OAN307_c07410 [Octadecabacter antarcticus 307]|uniref:Transposase DDE domain-containing protein n=1 Tax=Octadecabacter antarcticus 307 TaxID=391626 RepID=M9R839_9RHOB|nr:hypothetical protein OAN307_c07410 [Octadecabacter antarcticus 307]
MPLRQTTGFVETLLKLVDLDWEVPDFSTLCRRQKTLLVAIPYQGSKGPLNLLVPSRALLRMHCMKLLGQRLAARDFDRQVAEIQIRAAILNGFTALGIPRTVAVA